MEQKRLSAGEKIDQRDIFLNIASELKIASVLLRRSQEIKLSALGSRKLF